MKNFKQLLEQDLESTFYRTDEFAELRTVEYDGRMKKIPVIFASDTVSDRKISVKDKAEGLYKVSVVVRMQLESLGITPRKGKTLYIDDEEYKIDTVSSEDGEIILGLEIMGE
ncbi:MAG: hypothetical protein NC331_13845 [Lachnospiraceae bacterium]|nr:hypothetical protein [Lachnospiraceae bacterium]MCM1240447.1 hypothetical protein [Lachnospiraceae bacterium]